MITAAFDAFQQIGTAPFRLALLKIVALTLALLAVMGVGLEKLVLLAVASLWPWLGTVLAALSGLGLIVVLAYGAGPVSFIVAGFFFDTLADEVEPRLDPPGRRGRALPFAEAGWLGAKFAAVALIVNLAAFALLLVPGINAIAFFAANAYLGGRGYFELAALRYRPLPAVRRLRRAHAAEIFAAGLVIAAVLAVPVLNLLTPLFATAFMIRIHARISARSPQAPGWDAN